ncbi:UNVERIFIED_CONTAM: hypothetical protein PYX00_011596 [Menopon gallinae]|uniref:PCI domain-containing protein n=1 Tax=Menopon gallinae TaxID=328185 RepID=A0AAW2H832_9NEOP
MEEIGKTDKQTNKSAETVDPGTNESMVYNQISSEIQLLKNDIDTFSRDVPLRAPYDFENVRQDPRRVYYKKVVLPPKKPKKDTKKRIVDAWRYFYIIRNLPLSYLLKSTDKMIYMDEFLVMERENQDIRVFRQIEKMRRRGTLVEDIWEDCSGSPASECIGSSCYRSAYEYVIDRFRKCLFKKRVLSLRETKAEDRREELLGACTEYYKIIQRSIMRRKKESAPRRDASVHSSQTMVMNKIPQEVRGLVMPTEMAGHRATGDRPAVLGSHDKAAAVFKSGYVDVGRQPRPMGVAGTPAQAMGMEDTGRASEVFMSNVRSADGPEPIFGDNPGRRDVQRDVLRLYGHRHGDMLSKAIFRYFAPPTKMNDLAEREREARLAKDDEKIKEVFMGMLKACGSDAEVLSLMKGLGRRKGQLKQAYRWFVNHVFDCRHREAMQDAQGPRGTGSFMAFCHTMLKDIVEGKMFLEEERIKIASVLKDMYVGLNDMRGALDAIFDIPVETFTSVSEAKVVGFQLEQLRLAVVNSEWIKADVCSKKIRRRYFEETGDWAQEARYDSYMVDLCLGKKSYMEASKILLKVSQISEPHQNIVKSSFFSLIAPRSEERSGMIRTLILEKNNTESVRRALALFLKSELIQHSAMDVFRSVLGADAERFSEAAVDAVDIHNLAIVSRFCTFLSLKDLACLLQCSGEDVIDKICRAVNSGLLHCRIDQSRQLVKFNRSLDPDWIRDVDSVLDSLMEANHMIHTENLKYAASKNKS